MAEKARENLLESSDVESVLEFVSSDQEEADRIAALWPQDWPHTLEKTATTVTIRMKGTITEVQDRSISFLDKLKEANLPKPLKSSASSVKGGGDVSDEDNMDE